MAGRLQDKVAVVTGAASGMGEAEARLFAAEGARVVLADVEEQRGEQVAAEIRAAGGEAIFARADVAREEDWQELTARAEREFGAIDVLVNNAGIVALASVADCDMEEWARVVAVNQTGVFLGIGAVQTPMKARGGGAVVNTGSIWGMTGTRAYFGYQASKGAVVQMTRAAAVDLAPWGIRVNCICPGLIFTAMTESEPPAAVEENIAMTPMGRGGNASEVAAGALFLASDEASFVTGAILPIDGGYTAQ
ncbi:MAG: glucose 1-dehydrogenase [Solirubrobacterales bacterium]